MDKDKLVNFQPIYEWLDKEHDESLVIQNTLNSISNERDCLDTRTERLEAERSRLNKQCLLKHDEIERLEAKFVPTEAEAQEVLTNIDRGLACIVELEAELTAAGLRITELERGWP